LTAHVAVILCILIHSHKVPLKQVSRGS